MINRFKTSYNVSFLGIIMFINSCTNGEVVPKREESTKLNKEVVHHENESINDKDTLLSNNQDTIERLNYTNAKVEDKNLSKLDHSVFNSMLQNYVSNEGKVNYKKWKTDIETLKQYVQYLGEFKEMKSFNKKERLAYWINLYNSSTILMILENYPIESITKLENGKPWDKKWIITANGLLSLNDIENKIIRAEFADPRIHFALNCAAKSCPPLWNQAFTSKSLDKQLEERTRTYLNSKAIQIDEDELKLSKIFEWYAADFGDVKQFISTYISVKINDQAKITFKEYDWSLNI